MRSYFVGIDVSKNTLDIWIRPINKHWKLPNGNFSELITVLKLLQPAMIVLEATGGYELAVLRALNEANFNVCREHPYKIHHHAKARGQLAKTDRVDAKTIAHYAECYHSELLNNHLPSSKAHELKQLVTRRRQLVSLRLQKRIG